MRSNYKKLGQYIRQVNIRNTELEVDRLLGVSIKKVLMPSIANTVGTDMKTYKIICKNQFAYGAVTSRNGDKISIALLEEFDEAIVSQAYTVFEIEDVSKLLPEYLMMWFRRPEFDRYARFKSHGSARETFDWEEMLDTELPVPSIEKQREIVAEYNTIVDRIKLNEDLNKKLEETAQTLYKHWFVDFEFPDENGNPYKSSGGEMVYNTELEKEIPKGWEVKSIKGFGEVVTGNTPSTKNPEDFGIEMFFITPGDFKNYTKFALDASRKLSHEGLNRLKNRILPKGSVIVTCIGSDMGKVVIADRDCITNQQMNSIKVFESYYTDYLYQHLKLNSENIKSIALSSSTMPMINKSDFEQLKILSPINTYLIDFEIFSKSIDNKLMNSSLQNQYLEGMHDLLLSRMTRV